MTKARGRPRKFDPETALTAAGQLFWQRGYDATSLDQLAQAMDMNRPSIYNAFGGKRDIYVAAIDHFCALLRGGVEALMAEPDLGTALERFYDQAISIYCATDPQLGCMVMCTLPAPAVVESEFGERLRSVIADIDTAFEQRLRMAAESTDIADDIDIKGAARLLQATLHTIALRARAGETPRRLKQISRFTISLLLKSS